MMVLTTTQKFTLNFRYRFKDQIGNKFGTNATALMTRAFWCLHNEPKLQAYLSYDGFGLNWFPFDILLLSLPFMNAIF